MTSQDSQPFHWRYTELDDHNFQIGGRTLFFMIVIFAVVTIVTFVYLFTRWLYRFAHPSSPNAPHAPPPLPRGLELTAIDMIPIVLHRSKSTAGSGGIVGEEEGCCICLGEFEDGDKVKVLPNCRHCYHCECVDRWLSTCSSCPLCRNSIRVDSVLYSIETR